MMKHYGYARVSTKHQDLKLQVDQLLQVPCHFIYQEKLSGKNCDRPKLQEVLNELSTGDILVVTKLDRLARSLNDLVSLIRLIHDKGASFHCLTPSINTGSMSGKLILHILGAVAEFERELINERVKEGIASAVKNGVKFGRNREININHVKQIYLWNKKGIRTVRGGCRIYGISESSYYLYRPRAIAELQQAFQSNDDFALEQTKVKLDDILNK